MSEDTNPLDRLIDLDNAIEAERVRRLRQERAIALIPLLLGGLVIVCEMMRGIGR